MFYNLMATLTKGIKKSIIWKVCLYIILHPVLPECQFFFAKQNVPHDGHNGHQVRCNCPNLNIKQIEWFSQRKRKTITRFRTDWKNWKHQWITLGCSWKYQKIMIFCCVDLHQLCDLSCYCCLKIFNLLLLHTACDQIWCCSFEK